MRLLFIGESWLGSCARSMKEAIARHPSVCLEEVNEDLYMPKSSARSLRLANRVLKSAYRTELNKQIIQKVAEFNPEVVLVYKGSSILAPIIKRVQGRGCLTGNVYPDYSPHAYGREHKMAVGAYDLVLSTKPFHPPIWKTVYGYRNQCVFVPQGYDPRLHLVEKPVDTPRFDVTLVATWRQEYGVLLRALGELLLGHGVSVGIAGSGWAARKREYPAEWTFTGVRQGRAYIDWLRQGKICLAPLNRKVVIDGVRQPGDEDTTRTYELAAANCFFIHRRTGYVQRLYDEATEVPMYETPDELAEQIIRYLPRAKRRAEMAAAAHSRAVPAYSLDKRAAEIVSLLSDALQARRNSAN